MTENLVAVADVRIDAGRDRVWAALIDPPAIRQYMFGADIVTDWRVGSAIVWKGEWKGKPFEDKGVVLEVRPGRTLRYTHYSPMTGAPDRPENYHTVTITLSDAGNATAVRLTQDGNTTEKSRDESARNWENMLTGLKKYVESTLHAL
jgi:uncharacterized protein YndB with AHSA1/START domain